MLENRLRRVFYLSSLLFIFIFSHIYGVAAGMIVQACFSPGGECSKHIIRELDRAEGEILVALYAFTSNKLAWALVNAKKRGISVRVILDREFDKDNKFSKGSFLGKRGLPVRRASGLSKGTKGTGLMHQKFAIIDARVVLTGSYNWTASAEKFNDENLLLFRDAGPLAEEYRKEFFRLWERAM
jgi:phosphatidylserine/phosphatidylglycerophosphate/cardiolipin synthase-like enzyme